MCTHTHAHANTHTHTHTHHTSSSEFYDSAVYWATLTKLNESKRINPAVYAFWVGIHVVRTYLVLPCFILANASLIATCTGFESLLGKTFAAGLVLEIDELFFWVYIRLCGKMAPADSKLLLGAQTQILCDRVVNTKVAVLGAAELSLVVLMKTAFGNGLNLAWSLPLIATLLSCAYSSLPKSVGGDE